MTKGRTETRPETSPPPCLRPPWHPNCYWPKCKCADAQRGTETTLVSVPARCVQEGDLIYGYAVLGVAPGPGRSVRITIEGRGEQAIYRHMDDPVVVSRPVDE